MDALHFLLHVIRPTLDHLGMGGAAAERLMLGTALAESGITFVRQLTGGPARGVYQVEPATHDDVWDNWLRHRPQIREAVDLLTAPWTRRVDQLDGNLYYATAVARLVYRRRPEPLPYADDAAGMAAYHKQHFNTPKGKADPAVTVSWFRDAIHIHRKATR